MGAENVYINISYIQNPTKSAIFSSKISMITNVILILYNSSINNKLILRDFYVLDTILPAFDPFRRQKREREREREIHTYIYIQGLHLKSHQRCSAEIRTCLSAEQSSSSTLTQSIIYFLTLSYTQRHWQARLEKGPVQTVAIKLEAHNSLEYYY